MNFAGLIKFTALAESRCHKPSRLCRVTPCSRDLVLMRTFASASRKDLRQHPSAFTALPVDVAPVWARLQKRSNEPSSNDAEQYSRRVVSECSNVFNDRTDAGGASPGVLGPKDSRAVLRALHDNGSA